jgi:DNA-binding LacI/PurR family transcriptional regulator
MAVRNLTIKDVAAMARVSPGTVSKAINDAPGVGTETRKRILKLIQDLDYHPDASARSLVGKRSGNIGFVIPHTGSYSMASDFWPRLLTSITEIAAARNLNVLLSTARSEDDADSAYRSILRGRRVDGLIVGADQFRPKQLAELLFKGFPFVIVGKNPVVRHWHVDIDNRGGARVMARHLIDAGHRRIAMLAGPEELPWVRERVEGYCATMTEAGLEPRVAHCAFHTGTDQAEHCLRELLRPGSRASAICTAAGDLTLVVLAVAREMGLTMPSDLALVSFDEYRYFEYVSPPITAVSQPVFELGQAALDMLFTLMDGREPESRGRILPIRLIVRGSCGARQPEPISAN